MAGTISVDAPERALHCAADELRRHAGAAPGDATHLEYLRFAVARLLEVIASESVEDDEPLSPVGDAAVAIAEHVLSRPAPPQASRPDPDPQRSPVLGGTP